MKKSFFFLCMAIATLAACTSDETISLEGRLHTALKGQVNSNHITLENVMAVAGITRTHTRAGEECDYAFVTDDGGDTLFYVVNFPDGGWTMYASDKRVPAIVAYSETGRFDLKETERVMGTWFEAMKEDMKLVKLANDEELNFTEEEIEGNVSVWDAVCDADKFVQGHLPPKETRGAPLLHPEGHYVLKSMNVTYLKYDSINHLTQTRWHQMDPYNKWCPTKFSNSLEKAPAGCVAIAGAQLLYYLHYKIGMPDSIPDMASCTGNTQGYQMNQWNSGINTWNLLPNHGNSTDGQYAAPLIANVGIRVGMTYLDNGSKADTYNLVDNVFAPYGISCQYVQYDRDTLVNSLMNEMPVIARAGTQADTNVGHSFIIDGYLREEKRTTYTYTWVWDLPPSPGVGGMEPLQKNDSVSIVYDPPIVNYIKMNWGWEGQIFNEVWYTPSGDWLTNIGNYQYGRHIIFNFRRNDD